MVGSLVEVAQRILLYATELQKHLDQTSSPQPSLDTDGPERYPTSPPELVEARLSLIQASLDMVNLSRGPVESLLHGFLQDKSRVGVIKAIQYFKLPELVPLQGEISFEELGRCLDVDQEILQRILRYGFTQSVFKESRPGYVAHTGISKAMYTYSPFCDFHTDDLTINPYLKLPQTLEAWNKPTNQKSQQIPLNFAFGKDTDLWATLKSKETVNGTAWFSAAMHSFSKMFGDGQYGIIAQCVEWDKLSSGPVVDLGGANGHVSFYLAKQFPSLNFIVQDLPLNEAEFYKSLPKDLEERVSYQVQDAFLAQPQNLVPSAYFLKAIFHDWPDADCVRILHNLIPIMEKHGSKLIIMDRCLPENDSASTYMEANSRHADLLMFSLLGAKERSVREWEVMCKSADSRLRFERIVRPVGWEWGLLQLALDGND